MAKIILSMDGVVLQEMTLSKERVMIGRRPHNDLVVDNSAISAEHAVIVTMLRDAYLEDLNSTNGTRVNGQPIKKHFLKNNDVIELAKYKIRFVAASESQEGEAVNAARKAEGGNDSNSIATTVLRTNYRDGNTVAMVGESRNSSAIIKILNGPQADKEIPLNKPLTTIGLLGQQVAVVTRRGHVYSLTHVEGNIYPLVNGKSIGASAYSMTSGDVIDLTKTQMIFLLL